MVLAGDPRHLFSLIGWLTSISELTAPGSSGSVSQPLAPTLLGNCAFTDIACPRCMENLSRRRATELGSRAVVSASPGARSQPRLVRNHLLEPVFGRGRGRLFALNAAVFLAGLVDELVDAVTRTAKTRLYYSLPTRANVCLGAAAGPFGVLLGHHRASCARAIRACQDAADRVGCGVLLVEDDERPGA